MGPDKMTPFLQLTPAAAKRIWDRKPGPSWLLFDPAKLAGSWTFKIDRTKPQPTPEQLAEAMKNIKPEKDP